LIANLKTHEGVRAGLEKNIAKLQATQTSIYSMGIQQEHYGMLRNYAQALRFLRTVRNLKDSVANLKLPVWAFLPRISIEAPQTYTNEHGEKMVKNGEIASLSLVPENLRASWRMSDFIRDDEAFNDFGPGGPFITFLYPRSLDDVFVDVARSPLGDDYGDEEDTMDAFLAHAFENILDAAAALTKWGVSVNPVILRDGSKLFPGRLTPDQIKLQATVYQQQARLLLSKLYNLYCDVGFPQTVVQKKMASSNEFWDDYPTRLATGGSARLTFAVNAMQEANQAIGKLESRNRRKKEAEVDEKLLNIGKVLKNGVYVKPQEAYYTFYDAVDAATGYDPHSEATNLQAQGLSTRYVHGQFEEAECLRNIMVAICRLRVALEGTAQVTQAQRELIAEARKAKAAEQYAAPSDEAIAAGLKLIDKASEKVAEAGWGEVDKFFKEW
jgi:hypothetical protein